MQNVLIAGGSGLIGRRLTQILLEEGFSVSILGRNKTEVLGSHISIYNWDPATKFLPEDALNRADYIINLAGASISKRWSKTYKELIINSRIEATSTLVEVLNTKPHKVKALINGSASGFYGFNRVEELSENSEPGIGFLSETCEQWEQEAQKLHCPSTRLIILRTGIVLAKDGGAFPSMALPIRYWVGSKLGNGKQIIPWIHMDDLCKMMVFLLMKPEPKGIYNAVAPVSISNKEMTRAIAKAYHKPLLMPPVPGFMLRLFLGEFYKALIGSLKISATKIKQEGFLFQYPEIDDALEVLVPKKKS